MVGGGHLLGCTVRRMGPCFDPRPKLYPGMFCLLACTLAQRRSNRRCTDWLYMDGWDTIQLISRSVVITRWLKSAWQRALVG